jgi:DNA-directed RNA polymerase specialized sigma24 family protein
MHEKDYYHMTQQEVAERLGMPRSNVNYYERQALEKIRIALEKRGIKASDLLDVK